jgi:hypothetical protein
VRTLQKLKSVPCEGETAECHIHIRGNDFKSSRLENKVGYEGIDEALNLDQRKALADA